MENIIKINKTKEQALALSDADKIDLLGAIKDINDNYEKDIKKSLIAKGSNKIEGTYYKATISEAKRGTPKLEPNWDKIMQYAIENKKELPMTIDKEKTAELDWVIELMTNPEYFKAVKGKDYAGSVKIERKEI